METLEILDFSVIVRNMMDLGNPKLSFNNKDIIEIFQDIAQESEKFQVVDEVSKKLCSLVKDDIIRFALPPIPILDSPKNHKGWFDLTEEKITEEFSSGELNTLDVQISLHHSGVFQVYNYLHYQDAISVSEAITRARIQMRTVIMKIPEEILPIIKSENSQQLSNIQTTKEGTFFIGSLNNFCLDFLRPLFIDRLKDKFLLQTPRESRCHSSTLIQLYKTNPACEFIEEFISPKKFGKEIRGLTCLDRGYSERSETLVADSLINLSPDEETRVFTFGLSDIILFDQNFESLIEKTMQRKKYQDRYSAILFHTAQYSALLEWVYLEKYIIDLYNRVLSRAIAEKNNSPDKMLSIQKNSMHDLIGYKEGITFFPCREEFWQKARIAHSISDAQEKLEKKRDLATDYVIQEYTLRTNRSIQSVNIFVSATAAFSLVELSLVIWDRKQGHLTWSLIAVGFFLVMLVLFWSINNIKPQDKNT